MWFHYNKFSQTSRHLGSSEVLECGWHSTRQCRVVMEAADKRRRKLYRAVCRRDVEAVRWKWMEALRHDQVRNIRDVKLGTHWGLITQYTYCNTKQILWSRYCHNTCIAIHVIVLNFMITNKYMYCVTNPQCVPSLRFIRDGSCYPRTLTHTLPFNLFEAEYSNGSSVV